MSLFDSIATIEQDRDTCREQQDGGEKETVVKDCEQSPEQADISEASCLFVRCHNIISVRKQFMCIFSRLLNIIRCL